MRANLVPATWVFKNIHLSRDFAPFHVKEFLWSKKHITLVKHFISEVEMMRMMVLTTLTFQVCLVHVKCLVLSELQTVIHLNLTTTQWDFFIDEVTESQRGSWLVQGHIAGKGHSQAIQGPSGRCQNSLALQEAFFLLLHHLGFFLKTLSPASPWELT